MRDDYRPRLKLREHHLGQLAFDPGRAHHRFRLILKGKGAVDDGTAGLAGKLPIFASALWIGGKEREIHFVELLGAYALDEADLVTHRFQLSQRFVVIEQLDVERREIAVV